jgi:hypothetical protein
MAFEIACSVFGRRCVAFEIASSDFDRPCVAFEIASSDFDRTSVPFERASSVFETTFAAFDRTSVAFDSSARVVGRASPLVGSACRLGGRPSPSSVRLAYYFTTNVITWLQSPSPTFVTARKRNTQVVATGSPRIVVLACNVDGACCQVFPPSALHCHSYDAR